MSAIQTIIQTYIKLSDENALLALKAHRLKLLARIDENSPFVTDLRSQCLDEISAIEAGLAKLRPERVRPAARPIPGDSHGGIDFQPTWTRDAPATGEAASGRAEHGDDRGAEGADSTSSADLFWEDLNPWHSEPPSTRDGEDLAASPRGPALPIASPSDPPSCPGGETSLRETADTFERVLQFAPVTVASSFIAFWPLRLQDGPSQVDQGLMPMNLNAIPQDRMSHAAVGCLFAGLHGFADVCFGQRGDA